MFRMKTFGTKLLVVMLLMSGLAATFVCVSLVVRQVMQVRESTIDKLKTHGAILRTHSVAALRFNDPDAGNETLAALQAVPAIRRAEITTPDGSIFATYQNDQERVVVSHAAKPGYHFVGSILVLSEPIEHDGDSLGALHLYYDMRPTYAAIRSDIVVAGGMALAAMGLSLLLGMRLRKTLSQPVRELVGISRKVAEDQDYTQRAVHSRSDDLGEVMDVFNSMLDTIELRQAELQRAHDELEQRVRERTAELEAAKSRAEAANRSKTDFLANMSHEIRTPMTAILGYSEMLQDPEHSPSHRLECIQTIRRNGNHLLGLINDILDISKIEAGRMTVESCPTSLIGVIADVASLLRLRAGEKNLEFRVEYASAIPETILTDPTRLRQVLMNLLGNAVKFTETGSVTLRVELLTPQNGERGEPQLQLEIIDTGIGLTPDQIDGLFVPFSQADESVTRRFGGTGLGLAISRQLTRLLGGDIHVTSQPGRGSTFSITINTGPLDGVRVFESPSEIEAEVQAQIANSQTADSTEPTLHGRILLAEDGYDNQRLIRGILSAAGAEVTLVENGRLACEAVAQSYQAGEPFDLIFMDMQMPEMDGYTAARELRKSGCKLPIVALTAHALTGDRERCIEAGCNDYQSKPIDRRRLVRVAGQYMKCSFEETGGWRQGASQSSIERSTAQATNSRPDDDQSVLRSEWADDPAMTELISEFLSLLPERIHELERATAEQDLQTLAVLSHKLKGAGGGYGYAVITETARSLEQLARDATDLDAIRRTISELKTICDRARAGAPSTNQSPVNEKG